VVIAVILDIEVRKNKEEFKIQKVAALNKIGIKLNF